MTNNQKVANMPLGSFLVGSTRLATGEQLQHVIWVDEDDNIISPGSIGAGGSPVAATHAASTTVGTSSTSILAANTLRAGGYIQAAWSNSDNIYIALSRAATTNDIPIAPGGQFQLTLNYGGRPITNEIFAKAGSGTQAYTIVDG